MPCVFLPDSSLVHISGEEAADFLQNLITTDLSSLAQDEARPGALLTPQGKILFDFMIWTSQTGFQLEIAAEQRDAFIRRLTMYKLRAKVDIQAQEPAGMTVSWDVDAPDGVRDHRFEKAGIVVRRTPGKCDDGTTADSYDALRIASGVVISGRDYPLQDAFPHDVLLDRNGGLSFRKGCYVGQEVVSRMQHRGTARRRVVIVSAADALPASGTELSAGGKPIGTLGTVVANRGLAIVRIDRAADAMRNGVDILAADVAVSVSLPAWSGIDFPSAAADE